MSGWGESACRSAGEMGWRCISWPGRLTNPWWSRCIWASPDGATASASKAAACRAEESLAEEESGSAQSVPQLLQSTWGQGWRSDVCQDGTALPAAGITASMSLHLHNMLIDLYCALKQLVGWLCAHILVGCVSSGNDGEAASVATPPPHHSAPAVGQHRPHQNSHCQPRPAPWKPHTWHPIHRCPDGGSTTPRHTGRPGERHKNTQIRNYMKTVATSTPQKKSRTKLFRIQWTTTELV